MALPSHFGLGFSAAQALRVRALVAEAAPHCAECVVLLSDIDRQLAVLNGTPLPAEPGSCENC